LASAFACAPTGPHYPNPLTAFVKMGLAPLDRPHRELERCIRDLAEAVRARDLELLRGRACLLVEKLGEHFADEEQMMGATDWSQIARHKECHARLLFQARRFERLVAVSPLTPEIASQALNRLPELIRYHMIATDFGFAKHVLRRAKDPRPRLARRGHSPPQRG
jgi:hemerythrin-like metal-binding protein